MAETTTTSDLDLLKRRLSRNEKRVLIALHASGDEATPEALVDAGGFRVVQEVMSAANWLVDKGLATVEESTRSFIGLDEEGQAHAARGLPERRAVGALQRAEDGRLAMSELTRNGTLAPFEVSVALGWLKRKGWADIEKVDGETVLVLTEAGQHAAKGRDELLLESIAERGEVGADDDAIDTAALKDLRGRKGIIKEREATDRLLRLTGSGKTVASSGLEVGEELVHLTPEDIATGRWKDKEIRPYDVHAFAPTAAGGRSHPLTLLIEEIREVFVEMGFSEIATDYVESAFWNMDALFIPQDHPAREMQDTFYLDNPERIPSEPSLVQRIAAVHEHGGDTGSRGWGGRFSIETTEKALLRTHTTVGTIRYLAENPEPPCKVFSLGRVFRNETMDATHLPEFHQIEGIIKEPNANFRVLVGTLKEFYRRMGFPKVRVRPGYFPYTEPSMEVDVHYNGRWMELGGSGIFRPEVVEPFGVKDPVCAWGLGLERLAMMRFGLKDIRDIYVSDVDWLRNRPLHL